MVELLRHQNLMNRPVLDRRSLEEVGRVEVLWMHVPAHRVLGFVCKTGLLGNQKFAFSLDQVHSFGPDKILVNSPPQTTDAEKVKQLETLMGCQVWSDAGEVLGKVVDLRFDPATGQLFDYLFSQGRLGALADGIYQLPPAVMLSWSRRRVVVAADSVPYLQVFQPGLKRRVDQVATDLKQELTTTAQEVKDAAQEVTTEFRAEVNSAAQDLRAVTQHTTHQLKTTWADRAKDLGSQVKETAQTWSAQLQDGAEDLRDQVRDSLADWESADWDEVEWDELDITQPPTEATVLKLPAPTSQRSWEMFDPAPRSPVESDSSDREASGPGQRSPESSAGEWDQTGESDQIGTQSRGSAPGGDGAAQPGGPSRFPQVQRPPDIWDDDWEIESPPRGDQGPAAAPDVVPDLSPTVGAEVPVDVAAQAPVVAESSSLSVPEDGDRPPLIPLPELKLKGNTPAGGSPTASAPTQPDSGVDLPQKTDSPLPDVDDDPWV
jgi:uncharacterized protein YrrD